MRQGSEELNKLFTRSPATAPSREIIADDAHSAICSQKTAAEIHAGSHPNKHDFQSTCSPLWRTGVFSIGPRLKNASHNVAKLMTANDALSTGSI